MSKSNEPAFPEIKSDTTEYDDGRGNYINTVWSEGGLTKREYFAAMAMQGLVTATFNYERSHKGEMTPDFIAEHSFKQADAMIRASEKSHE